MADLFQPQKYRVSDKLNLFLFCVTVCCSERNYSQILHLFFGSPWKSAQSFSVALTDLSDIAFQITASLIQNPWNVLYDFLKTPCMLILIKRLIALRSGPRSTRQLFQQYGESIHSEQSEFYICPLATAIRHTFMGYGKMETGRPVVPFFALSVRRFLKWMVPLDNLNAKSHYSSNFWCWLCFHPRFGRHFR